MPKSSEPDVRLAWSARWSVTTRILAVNIFALALLAGGFFYLDSYRTRLIDAQLEATVTETLMMAQAMEATPAARWPELAAGLGVTTSSRLRLYDANGMLALDGWRVSGPTYDLRDPRLEPFRRKVARFLDRVIDRVAGAETVKRFQEPPIDTLAAWPEAIMARGKGEPQAAIRRAPDRTPMVSAAVPLRTPTAAVLLVTTNARDVTRTVRAERLRLGIVIAIVVLLSVLLSLFLARTIARPLRRLAIAAHRVRLGRAREVQVPRLPSRHDEIGTLARALSDMSLALRQRIDATEAFAADVAHEIKNPLASLRSAVDSLERVRDPELQKQLVGVIHDDVARLDRLITDISEASRVDAELARTRFETIDLGPMIEGLVATYEARCNGHDVRLAFARPNRGIAVVFGDGSRLARVIENLVDNAISFSPAGGLVQIAATRDGEHVVVRVEDEGPGVPPEARSVIFNRFHSDRPADEEFGRHSGLGLAIAKAIVEGHNGSIEVTDRENAPNGACFVIRLPAASR